MFDFGLSPLSYFPLILFPTLMVVAILWDLIWKGLGMWAAARNNQKGWFIVILIVNSLGIVPIVYLAFFQGKKKVKRKKK